MVERPNPIGRRGVRFPPPAPRAFAPKSESIVVSFTFDDSSRTEFGVGWEDFQEVRRRLAVYGTVVVAVIMFGSFGEAQFTALFAIASGLHRPLIARVPEDRLDGITSLRANWNSFHFRNRRPVRATPPIQRRVTSRAVA